MEEWGETQERIQKLKNSVETVIYTPASQARPPYLNPQLFSAPSKELISDTGAFRDRILSLTSSVLGLLGINADPIKSRENILIASTVEQMWRQGQDLDLAMLIQLIQKPPFEKIGALDVDTFFPPKERLELSIRLNNLLASPGFKAWMEGEPLDINQLLYTKEGTPKHSIITIAHLTDSERMFFVTLLLNEIISWMRRQSGSSNLKAILYMDEVFGYFPPTAMPPSKTPMLTLLKQARAFGLGVMLCTQNPVDIDYKGLSNCGSWFIGKLQTERDKARVLEGLRTASNGDIDEETINKLLSSIEKRTFILRSIYEKNPILFQTRWTLSYLSGPLTLSQITSLTKNGAIQSLSDHAEKKSVKEDSSDPIAKPFIPTEIPEFFLNDAAGQKKDYVPYVLGMGKLHFVDSKNKIDVWQDICWLAPPDEEGKNIIWENGRDAPELKQHLEKAPLSDSLFRKIPTGLMQFKNYSAFEKSLSAYLYQNQTLSIYQAPELKLTSKEGETESAFRTRIALASSQESDVKIRTLKEKYNERISALSEKLRKAKEQAEQKQEKAGWQKAETAISFFKTVLGAFLGKGITKGTISEAGTSLKRVGKISSGSQDINRAKENVESFQEQLDRLQSEMEEEIAKITKLQTADKIDIQSITIRPRKSDISIEKVALVWIPN